jgi:DNA-binding transcriptional ArsR family regulator
MAPVPRSKHTLVDLAHIRALANPLRLRILGALVGEPRTTKQVAELVGEKPTKLYHHVQAMERAQLVRLVSTRPKRGTVEKYYQATATLFQAGKTAFSVGARPRRRRPDHDTLLVALLDTAREDLAAYFASSGAHPRLAGGGRLLVGNRSAKSRAAVMRQIGRVLGKIAAGPRGTTYGVTIVLCPVTTGRSRSDRDRPMS